MLKIGIVGLPNAGKSTLFNALVKGHQAEAANFPFCTIEPNVGIVEVPDGRLNELAALIEPEKITPAAFEFIDIAGLVEGAHKGEGLGNKFLSHIKEANAITLVLRTFEDADISHVYGNIDPVRDYETLMLELVMSDLATVSAAFERAERAAHDGKKETKARAEIIGQIKKHLEQNQPVSEAREILDNEDARQILRELQLITAKPRLIVFNISETDASNPTQNEKIQTWIKTGAKISTDFKPEHIIYISSKLEAELLNMNTAEQSEFLAEYKLTEPGLNRLIKTGYAALGLQSFFTAGPQEVRAWTIRVGTNAQVAAGEIHTDFSKKFVKAEVVKFSDYIFSGGEAAAKEKGLMRQEGREYKVADGDVIYFKIAN